MKRYTFLFFVFALAFSLLLLPVATGACAASGHPAAAPAPREDQVSFAAVAEGEVIDRLRRAQVDSLTPLEALQLLYELKKKLT